MTKTDTYSQSLSLIYSYKWRNQAPTLSPYHCFTCIRNKSKHLSSVNIINLLVQVTKTSTYPQLLSLIYSYKWRKQAPTLSPYHWFTRTSDENKHLPSLLLIDLLVKGTKTSTFPQSLLLNYSYKWRNKAPTLSPYLWFSRTSDENKHQP